MDWLLDQLSLPATVSLGRIPGGCPRRHAGRDGDHRHCHSRDRLRCRSICRRCQRVHPSEGFIAVITFTGLIVVAVRAQQLAAEAALEAHNRMLEQRVTERTAEIQDKSRQLAEASERKSQFLASMSHELRTPLNAIIGLTEMMVTNATRFGTEKALEPLRRVNTAGTHLLSLINEVLD